jgi:hypothetical protein
MKLTIEPVEFTVGTDTYRHIPLGSEDGLELAREVMSVIGPSIGMILGSTGQLVVSMEQLANAEITPDVMSKAVESFATKVSTQRLKALAKQMVERTELRTADDDGTGQAAFVPLGKRYDIHFAGRIKAQLGFLSECLKANLADFFASA